MSMPSTQLTAPTFRIQMAARRPGRPPPEEGRGGKTWSVRFRPIFAQPAEFAIEATVVRWAPQVMIKCTGGRCGMNAIAAHFRFISKTFAGGAGVPAGQFSLVPQVVQQSAQ